MQRSRFNFLREAQIWYDRNPEQTALSDQFENVIVLSDEFYREITSHPIPTDLEAVKVLAGAPLPRSVHVALLPLLCSSGAGINPTIWRARIGESTRFTEYSRPRRFREKLEQWLKMIRLLWSGCPAQINREGDALLVGRGSAVRTAERIGV